MQFIRLWDRGGVFLCKIAAPGGKYSKGHGHLVGIAFTFNLYDFTNHECYPIQYSGFLQSTTSTVGIFWDHIFIACLTFFLDRTNFYSAFLKKCRANSGIILLGFGWRGYG